MAAGERSSALTQREEEDRECSHRECDAFLDRFAAMMNHEKVGAFLDDQERMSVVHGPHPPNSSARSLVSPQAGNAGGNQ